MPTVCRNWKIVWKVTCSTILGHMDYVEVKKRVWGDVFFRVHYEMRLGTKINLLKCIH